MKFPNQGINQFGMLGQTLRDMATSKNQVAEMMKGIYSANQSIKQFGMLGQTLRDMAMSKNQISEMMKSIHSANQGISKFGMLGQTLRDMATSKNQVAEMMKGIDAVANCKFNTLKHDVVIHEDNTISCTNKTFNLIELESDLRNIVEEVIDPNNINRRLDNLDKKLDGMKKDPLYKQILIAILIWFIIAFCIEPLIKHQLARYSPQNRNSMVRKITKSISSLNIEKDLLKDYRIVNTYVLEIRAKNKIKSKCLGKLYLGQVVRVVKKNKKWTLIELKDEASEVTIRGWVFTRYLNKISK